MKKSLMGILLVMAIAITACGATQPETAPVNDTASEAEAPDREEISLEVVAEDAPSEDTMVEEAAADEMMEDEASTDEMIEEDTSTHDMADEVEAAAEAAMETDEAAEEGAVVEEEVAADTTGPDWYNVDLVDVSTGETFKVNDLQGKVILIETMAVWCPICTQQQQQTRLLHDELGEREDFVSLSLDIDPNESQDILKSHVDRYGFNWLYAVVPPEVSREIGDLYGRQYLNPPAAPMLIIDRQGEAHLLPFGVKGFPQLQEAVMPFLNEG